MTSQPRQLGGMIPSGAPVIGQSIRIKTTAPFATEWYQADVSSVQSVAGKSGIVTLVHTDISDWNATLAAYAPLSNPGFGGVPTAPTASFGTNTTQLATTAFVQGAVSGSIAGVASFNARTGIVTLTFADITAVFPAGAALPTMNGAGFAGSAVSWSRSDHQHPSDSAKLSLSGGTMTGNLLLSADPTLPAQAATKNYVDNLNLDAGTY